MIIHKLDSIENPVQVDDDFITNGKIIISSSQMHDTNKGEI